MGLTSASGLSFLQWSQQILNPPFSPATQSATNPLAVTFTISDTGVDTVYSTAGTIAALSSLTIDLQNLTDSFGNSLVFTRFYSLQVTVAGAELNMGPGAVNPCQWFWGSTADRINIKPDSNNLYLSQYPFPVTAGGKTLDLFNTSATTELEYTLVIIGGQGAGTTTTTTTTATTGTSSTTAVPSTTTTATSSSSTSTSTSSTSGTTSSTTTT
jgi:hypothetical protein